MLIIRCGPNFKSHVKIVVYFLPVVYYCIYINRGGKATSQHYEARVGD
jgi:hypothetical protein